MDFDDLIIKRSSIRAYKNTSVDEESVNQIIQQTISAPSAGNLQAYKIYIVQNKETLKEIAKAAPRKEFIAQVNLAFVFCSCPDISEKEFGERGKNLYTIQDTTIAATYCQLAATNLGLSSVWVGSFKVDEVSKILNIPKNEEPIAIIPVGEANEIVYPTDRKNIDQVISIIK